MTLSLNSEIEDIFKTNLPRNEILLDIHTKIIDTLLSMKPHEDMAKRNAELIKGGTLYHCEGFYRLYYELAFESSSPTPPDAAFPGELWLIYGLLLPYYLDYSITDFSHINHFDKPIENDKFRVIKPLKDTDFPHPLAVHHAHQLLDIFIDRISHINKPSFQATLKKPDPHFHLEKRRFFKSAFLDSMVKYPDINNKERLEVILERLEVIKGNRPVLANVEYDDDWLKTEISKYKNGKMHRITWFEIPSVQDEFIEYIRKMTPFH